MRAAPIPRMRTVAAAVAVTLAIVIGLAPPQPTSAAPDESAEMYLYGAVNDVRTQSGLPPVSFRDDILDVARWHTERMAGEGRLFHNPERQDAVAQRVPDWQRIGENVGWATTPQGLHWLFMQSDTHRHVIMGDYTQVAIAVTYRDGKYWATELFINAPSR